MCKHIHSLDCKSKSSILKLPHISLQASIYMYNGNRLTLKNNVRGFCKANPKKESGGYNLLKTLFN